MAELAQSAYAARSSALIAAAQCGLSSESQSTTSDIDRQKLEIEWRKLHLDRYRARIEQHRVHHDARKPYIESGIKFADVTIRSLLILNGGAALALLAFAGNAATRAGIQYLPKLSPALAAFGWGATLGVLTPALAYVAQLLLLRPTSHLKREIGVGLRFVAILTAAASLAAFFFGIQLASTALT